jgi:hypothetical protein
LSIYVIDKLKPKNDQGFKVVDSSDINWDEKLSSSDLSDVYSKSETDAAISAAINDSGHLSRIFLKDGESLPSAGRNTNTIYLVKVDGTEDNVYEEWIDTTGEGSWEKIGDTAPKLNDYYKKADVDTLVESAGAANAAIANQLDKELYEKVTGGYQVTETSDDGVETVRDGSLQDAVNVLKDYIDTQDKTYSYDVVSISHGGMMNNGATITNIPTPVDDSDVANKSYVDAAITNLASNGGTLLLTKNDITSNSTNPGAIIVKGTVVPVYGLKSAAYVETTAFCSKDELEWGTIQ